MESTKEPGYLTRTWNERDTQIMVLLSLMLQLILLFAGNVRRRYRVGWLRFVVWLAYLASYAVAVSAIGLYSQYEDKYKLRDHEPSADLHRLMLPFLWAPFLLLHLGGPDTITAFSMEDNNLWTRQLISLLLQLGLPLYVFWKSFDLLGWQLLAVAVPLFVAGIIKYGERIWALHRGSRDNLDHRPMSWKENTPPPLLVEVVETRAPDSAETRALDSAINGRGLLVGRTLIQLGARAEHGVTKAFAGIESTDEKLKIVLIELGMVYDMLYTKVFVLLSWKGGVFRGFALLAMLVAFVVFWVDQHLHVQTTVNAVITYILFVAAMFVEVYSIFLVIASPWTRARSTAPYWLSHKLAHYCFPSQGLSNPSIGQFNLTDYSLSKKSMPRKISEALGLEKHWINLCHVKHVEDNDIVTYIVELLNPRGGQSQQLQLGTELKEVLCLPFEHTIFRLHIFTEIYLSEHYLSGGVNIHERALVAECRKLSNYLMYLMTVCSSMLPVTSAAQDFGPLFVRYVSGLNSNFTRARILQQYAANTEGLMRSPFGGTTSLEEIKEVWARVLIYAAGRCAMELHARQLGTGVELLTVVASFMMHHGLGNLAEKVELLAPVGFLSAPPQEAWVAAGHATDPTGPGPSMPSLTTPTTPPVTVPVRPTTPTMPPVTASVESTSEHPLYAFEFLDDEHGIPRLVNHLSLFPVWPPPPVPQQQPILQGPSVATQSTSQPSTSHGPAASFEIEEQAGGYQ